MNQDSGSPEVAGRWVGEPKACLLCLTLLHPLPAAPANSTPHSDRGCLLCEAFLDLRLSQDSGHHETCRYTFSAVWMGWTFS